jgi:hypothetical protein
MQSAMANSHSTKIKQSITDSRCCGVCYERPHRSTGKGTRTIAAQGAAMSVQSIQYDMLRGLLRAKINNLSKQLNQKMP